MISVPATQTVSADYLEQMLLDARRRTRALTDDLSGQRLLGPNISIVNPTLWEVGHIGFFTTISPCAVCSVSSIISATMPSGFMTPARSPTTTAGI